MRRRQWWRNAIWLVTSNSGREDKTRVNIVPDPRSPSTQMSIGELRVWLARLNDIHSGIFISQAKRVNHMLCQWEKKIFTWLTTRRPRNTVSAVFLQWKSLIDKIEKLLTASINHFQQAPVSASDTDDEVTEESAAKRQRYEDEGSDNTGNSIWLVFNEWFLTSSDKDVLQNGKELTDWHVKFGLKLLNQKFPFLVRLLPIYKILPISGWSYSFANFSLPYKPLWVTVSTIGGQANQVFIYDSL